MFSLRGNVLFICVSCLIFRKMSSAESITNFFPDIKGNLSRVTWAHAVNNLTYLTSTLNNSNIMMIEADVVMGTLVAVPLETIPIMGHPPAKSSDLSLEMFLKRVTEFNNNVIAGTTDNSSNNTTNIPDPNNSTNVNGTSSGNSTSDISAAGINNNGADGINATNPNDSSNSSGISGTNTSATNTTGTSNTIDSGIILTSPNDTNVLNITDIYNGTNDSMNNSIGTNDTNTAVVDNSTLNSTTPDNANSANSSVPVNTARLANTSDNISNTVNSLAKKGVKLDFKTIEAFSKSVDIIRSYSNASFPLWLNADILPGPVNPTGVPVNATQFLSQAQQFRKATLSLGWTTTVLAGTGSYTDKQIDEMINAIKKHNITNEITFAVRSALAAESLLQMKKLLLGSKDSTLTLWSAETDKVNVAKLRMLIADIGLDKIYIDVPDSLMKQLDLANLPGKPSSASLVSKMSGIVLLLTFLIVVFA